MTPTARCQKFYSTLATFAVAAIIAAIPVVAEATPTYLDITSYGISVSTSGTSHTFTGTAKTYLDISGGSQNNISPWANFTLTFDESTNNGTFSIGSLLAGTVDHLDSYWSATPGTQWGTQYDNFEFSISTDNTGSLNNYELWSGDITIAFNDSNPGGASNVSNTIVTAPVPEPATLSLMLLGGSALLGARRRRKALAI